MNDMRSGSYRRQTEERLISRVRASDMAAFESIYRANWPNLVASAQRFCRLLPQEAREIAQEIFLDIWRHRTTWTVAHGLAAYLLRALHHRVRQSGRLLMRYPNGMTASDLKTTIDAIVDSMPPLCRDVYHLHYMHGLDDEATAYVLDVSASTVQLRRARALHLLARGLAAADLIAPSR